MTTNTLPNTVILYCDGLCEPRNPGGYGCYGWIAWYDGTPFVHDWACIGHGEGITNNLAEYHAVLAALRWAVARKHRFIHAGVRVLVRTDSQLIARQIAGTWQCGTPHLIPLCNEARGLLDQLDGTIEWIPRAENDAADALSRRAYAEARRKAA